jgi:hypothetical protein
MLLPFAVLMVVPTAGCFSPSVRLDSIDERGAIVIVFDCNARVTYPGRALKFFVDVVNKTEQRIELNEVEIDINIYPKREPTKIALTKRWTFRWEKMMSLPAGKKLTLPINPEITTFSSGRQAAGARRQGRPVYASDFPIAQMQKGEYLVRAIVNERHVSQAYELRVSERPRHAGRITPTRQLETRKSFHRSSR